MSDTKYCPSCQQDKPVSEFYLRHKGKPNRYGSACKLCESARRIRNYIPKSEIKTELRWVNGLECGVCGEQIKDPRYCKHGLYLCNNCRPVIDRGNDNSLCRSCLWLKFCRSRVKLGMWLLCERPVVEDIERLAIWGVEEYKFRPEVIQK